MTHAIDSTLAVRVRDAIAAAPDADAAMAAAVAMLAGEMPAYNWVGIYLLEHNELVLGPFVGTPSPHSRIPLGRGICGAAAAEQMTIIVDDVNCRPALSRLQPRDPVGDRRADHARRLGAGRTRHRQSPAGRIRRDRPRPAGTGGGASVRAPRRARRRLPMTHTIVLVPGDGIGPEVSEAVLRIIKVAGVSDRVGAVRRRAARARAARHDAAHRAARRHQAGRRSRSRAR